MIFANAMNTVSIAAERFESEFTQNNNYIKARAISYKAAFIPTINALFAVGLVSLPGMMTGQILSSIDPLELSLLLTLDHFYKNLLLLVLSY